MGVWSLKETDNQVHIEIRMKPRSAYLVALLAVVLVAGCSSNSETPVAPTPTETPPAEEEVATPTPETIVEEMQILTPEGLLEFNDKPEELVGQSYKMDLFLESVPLETEADFTILKDGNDLNNTVIQCKMNPGEVASLDEESTITEDGPQYKLEVKITGFNDALTPPFYEGECKLN